MRKKHNRRALPVNLNPVQVAIELARKLPEARVDGVCSRLSTTVVELHAERGVRQQVMAWKALGDSANIAEQLAVVGVCSDAESRALFNAWQVALASVWGRIHAKSYAGFVDGEAVAITEGLARYEVQLRLCSRREYENAVRRVAELVRQALTGNAGKNDIPIGYLGDVVRDADVVLVTEGGAV